MKPIEAQRLTKNVTKDHGLDLSCLERENIFLKTTRQFLEMNKRYQHYFRIAVLGCLCIAMGAPSSWAQPAHPTDEIPWANKDDEELKNGMYQAQRHMRDLYHGWTTKEGMWSDEGQSELDRALTGNGDPEEDFKILMKTGLLPMATVVRGMKMKDLHTQRQEKVRAAIELAETYDMRSTLKRARALLNRIEQLQYREKKQFMDAARAKIAENKPDLVGSASKDTGVGRGVMEAQHPAPNNTRPSK